MSLSKFKSLKKFKAVKKFTDREQPVEIFNGYINKMLSGEEVFNVLVFYGVGGVGKTTLLKKFKNSLNSNSEVVNSKVEFISVNMDAYEFDTYIDILINIRYKLIFQTDLFDYAIAKYWLLAGFSINELTKKLANSDLIKSLLDIFTKVEGETITSALWKEMIKEYKNSSERLTQHIDDLNSIDDFDVSEIEERLPYYLGADISHEYEKNSIINIFFFDTCEILLRKGGSSNISDEWLQEFIGSCENGLFIIGSRELVKWHTVNPEWNDILDQHILGKLSDKDADYFLKNVPIKEPEIRKSIIELANGLPLYLDLCVNIYSQNIDNKDNINTDLFKIPQNEIVNRFLSHLEKEEQEIIKIISTIPFFDFNLFAFMLKQYNRPSIVSIYDDLIGLSFVLRIDKKLLLYKVHDYVREQIASNISYELRTSVIKNTIIYLSENKVDLTFEQLKKYYSAILSVHSENIEYLKNEIEIFLDLSLYLIDNGYWKDVGTAIEGILTYKNIVNKRLKDSLLFLKSIYLRRTGDVMQSLELISNIEISEENLGKYHILAEFNRANYIRLSGNYDKAESLYQNLSNSINFNDDSLFYTKIKRQYADFIFLRGNFKKSLELIEEIQSIPSSSVEKAETSRISGHIYRFNQQFENAEAIYQDCLNIANNNKSIGLLGKTYTNLTETLCWTNPDKAIKYSEHSVEINEQLLSLIELGKTYASLSIAYLMKNEKELAIKFADKSKNLQIQAGYQSGILFAELSKFLISVRYQDEIQIKQQISQITYLTNELNVYDFLKLPIFIYQNNINELCQIKNKHQWLNFEHSVSFFVELFNSWFGYNKWENIIPKLAKVEKSITSNDKIFFSYAWGDNKEVGKSREEIINKLYDTLNDKNYEVVRDKMDLSYKGLISEFMQQIGEGQMIIVAISEKYLKSPYCMFELYEIFRNSKLDKKEFTNKIFPIHAEYINLNDPLILDEYYTYWEEKEKAWSNLIQKRMDKVGKEQFAEYDKVKQISLKFGDLASFVMDMNALTPEMLSENNFEKMIAAIDNKLNDNKNR